MSLAACLVARLNSLLNDSVAFFMMLPPFCPVGAAGAGGGVSGMLSVTESKGKGEAPRSAPPRVHGRSPAHPPRRLRPRLLEAERLGRRLLEAERFGLRLLEAERERRFAPP